MSRGASGRIVIEIDPDMKSHLYQALDRDGQCLKEWFLARVEDYLAGAEQIPLPLDGGDSDGRAVA